MNEFSIKDIHSISSKSIQKALNFNKPSENLIKIAKPQISIYKFPKIQENFQKLLLIDSPFIKFSRNLHRKFPFAKQILIQFAFPHESC